ncbi:MAG: sulfatase [Armatimonadetes bacterium]|nr:sulfatase [Armatimonadota bacterium]
MPRPLNVILWTCHDMGTACGPYGDRNVPTPNLDRLAAAGATFANNFCTTPLCSPSRGSIQTGCYPHVNGLIGLVNQGWDLPPEQRCLVNYVADAGYETHLLGFQHIRAERESLGFDHFDPAGTRAEVAGERVATLLATTADRPRYIEVNTAEAHRRWSDDDGSVDPDDLTLPPYWPDTAEVRADLAGFYRHVLAVDRGVGRVLDALDQGGRGAETLFVFTVDHGIAFPRCKSTLYDSGLKTALLMRLDHQIPAGLRVETLLSNVDLCPTVLELAELPRPRGLDGRSFRRHARGEAGAPHRQWVYAEKSWHDDYDPMRCLRSERWKYIRNLQPGPRLTLPLDLLPEFCGTARAMANSYLANRPTEELYDLHEDPHELHNLAAEPELETTLRDLRGLLDDWMSETADPFLEHGSVPAPARQYQGSQRGRQWWPPAG